MALISKPSSPGWRSVRVTYEKAKKRNVSQFTFQAQTYIEQGERWLFEFTLPNMNTTQAGAWWTFLHSLAKNDDTFSCNVSAYVPSGAPGTMTLRLAGQGNQASWDLDEIKRGGITFIAETAQ